MFLALPFTPTKADWPFYGVAMCLTINLLLTVTAIFIHDRSEQTPVVLDGAISGHRNSEQRNNLQSPEDGPECVEDGGDTNSE